jgi:hypothetical protein
MSNGNGRLYFVLFQFRRVDSLDGRASDSTCCHQLKLVCPGAELQSGHSPESGRPVKLNRQTSM